jgi:hypothetical protein
MERPELGFVDVRPFVRAARNNVPPGHSPISYCSPAWRPAPLRALIENEIERLIAFLDMIDGDPDLEDIHDHERDYEGGTLEFGIDQSPIFIGGGPRSAKAP